MLRGDFTFSTYEIYNKKVKLDDVIKVQLKEYEVELVK
jgi:hypothetical protein